MSSSSDEDNEGYFIVKASSFRQVFLDLGEGGGLSYHPLHRVTWAKGADFLTIPFTGTKIRCVLENLENLVVDPCMECVEVWERSG